MTEQKKLDALVSGFRELDEGRKDYIRGLTQKLADIHCSGGIPPESAAKNREKRVELHGVNQA
jgi:hypothetical protein